MIQWDPNGRKSEPPSYFQSKIKPGSDNLKSGYDNYDYKKANDMNGARVLQILGLLLLLIGGAGVAFQFTGNAPPVMWLGAIGPVIMGIALLLISRYLAQEK